MAFAGMFLIVLLIVLMILGICTITAAILLIVSGVMHRKEVQRVRSLAAAGTAAKISRKYWIPRTIGLVFLLPLVGTAILVVSSIIGTRLEQSRSLSVQVNEGNFAQAERLLKKGISPDCTRESNDPAQNGEETLLHSLCANGGFADRWGDPVDDIVTQDELRMIQLLIDYGADLEAVSYSHEEGARGHSYHEPTDYYFQDDGCGRTPLLAAVSGAHEEIVELLIQNGADITAVDYCGFNAIAILADNADDASGYRLLVRLHEAGVPLTQETNFRQSVRFLAGRQTNLENDRIQQYIEEHMG